MPEFTKAEILKRLDYASLILQLGDAPTYPDEYERDAYYGFYLLARSVGNILRLAVGSDLTEELKRQKVHIELAQYYLETASDDAKKAFAKKKPLTSSLVESLYGFLETATENWDAEQSNAFVEKINETVAFVETSRVSKNELRSLDRYLARQWCRLLRVFSFLRVPPEHLPKDYVFERDIALCEKRGIGSEAIFIIGFRIRFYRSIDAGRPGKLILLAEEWEKFTHTGKSGLDPFEYEMQVLTILDTDAHYKIGMEWVTLLEHRHPDNLSFIKWHVRFLRHAGDYPAALNMLDDLLLRAPDDHETYYLKSNLCFLNGEYQLAKKFSEEAVRLGPNDPSSHLASAYAHLYLGEYERCLESFRHVVSQDSTLVDAYRGMANAQIMLGFPVDAMKNLRKAVHLDPEDAELYHNLADVYFMCGYLKECRAACKKCLELDPECAGAYVLLGMLEIRINHESNAGKWLTRALEIEPSNPIALNELAYLHHLSGNDEEALSLLEKALSIAPDFPDVTCGLGTVYYYQSDFDTALDYFDRTLRLDPTHAGAIVGKGNLYLAQSDAEEAITWFDRALTIESDNEEAIQGKISAYRAMGLEQEAFELMQKANEMGIDTEDDM